MFGLPPEHLAPILNILGLGFLGIVTAFGLWLGKRWQTADKTVEVAGALVDGASVRLLAAAIEALNVNHAQNRHSAEKDREVAHRVADALEDVTKEMAEIRKELRELGKTIAKH